MQYPNSFVPALCTAAMAGLLLASHGLGQDVGDPAPADRPFVRVKDDDTTKTAAKSKASPPHIIIIETADTERSEVIRRVVETLEKAGVAKRADDDRVGKPVDFHAEIHARSDVPFEKLQKLVETLKALSIGRFSFATVSEDGGNSVIVSCPADATWRQVRTLQEELEKLTDFKFDVRVAASNEPVTPTAPGPIQFERDVMYFGPGPAAPATGAAGFNLTRYTLKHAAAKQVVSIVDQFFGGNGNDATFAVDERTNSILVQGDKALHEKVARLIEVLDTPAPSDGPRRETTSDAWYKPSTAGTKSGQPAMGPRPGLGSAFRSLRSVSGQPATGPRPSPLDFAPNGEQVFSFYIGINIDEESAQDLRQKFIKLEQRTQELATRLRGPLPDPGTGMKLKEELRDTVRQAFQSRQKLQRAELVAFAKRLQGIQQSIEMRDRISQQIVDRRVEELLDVNLKWEPVEQPLPPASGREPQATESSHAPTDTEHAATWLASLQGRWDVTMTHQEDGKPKASTNIASVQGNQIDLCGPDGSNPASFMMHFEPAGFPQQVDLIPVLTPAERAEIRENIDHYRTVRDGSPVFAGIIEAKGDEIRLCMDAHGMSGRPIVFAASPATAVWQLRRPQEDDNGSF